jgi:hypothetical protein
MIDNSAAEVAVHAREVDPSDVQSPVTGWPGCMSVLPEIDVDRPRLSTTRNDTGRLRNVATGCEPARRPRIVP